MKRGKKKRGGIDGSLMKEKEGDDYKGADSWDEHNFDVGGKGGEEWGKNERDEGDGETTQMVMQIELEDNNATEADRVEAEKKAAAIEMEITHRALLVYELKIQKN